MQLSRAGVTAPVGAIQTSDLKSQAVSSLNALFHPNSEVHSGTISVGYKSTNDGTNQEVSLRSVKLPTTIDTQSSVSITLNTTNTGMANLSIGGLNNNVLHALSQVTVVLTTLGRQPYEVKFRKPYDHEGFKDLAKAEFTRIPKGVYQISFK